MQNINFPYYNRTEASCFLLISLWKLCKCEEYLYSYFLLFIYTYTTSCLGEIFNQDVLKDNKCLDQKKYRLKELIFMISSKSLFNTISIKCVQIIFLIVLIREFCDVQWLYFQSGRRQIQQADKISKIGSKRWLKLYNSGPLCSRVIIV